MIVIYALYYVYYNIIIVYVHVYTCIHMYMDDCIWFCNIIMILI